MPDKKDPAPEDAYRTDTFSRNDGEGLPGPEVAGDVSAALEAGEEGEFDTDTFSRGDREGAPGVDEEGPAEPKPDPLKATDDRDSRDAVPPPVVDGQGGVR